MLRVCDLAFAGDRKYQEQCAEVLRDPHVREALREAAREGAW